MMRCVFGRPAVLFVLLLGSEAFASGTRDLREVTRLLSKVGCGQIELRRAAGNHLYQIGRLNGKRGSFLVDTGWSFTTAQLGKNFPPASPEILSFGGVSFTNQPVRMEKVLFNGRRAAFDVVLGLDFLQRNFAVLDCSNRRLYTRTSKLTEAEQKDFEAALRRAGFCAIDLKLKTPPALTLVAEVNGEPVELLLDSGAVWSCLDERQRSRLNLKPLPSPAKITGAGKTGIRAVAVTDVKSIQLGEIALKSTTVALFDLSDWGFAAPGKMLSEVQGVFGGDLLLATSAVIDCHEMKLWIKPRSKRN